MAVKLSPDFVRQFFELQGYTLLEDYKNARQKLEFICPNGHQHSMLWNSFQYGRRCGFCAGLYVSPDFVRQSFADIGYELLSEYRSNQQKLDFICSKGHKHSISWNSFQRGNRCGVCAGKHTSTDVVRRAFAGRGYTLLGEYKSARQKLEFICPEGHSHSMSWNYFQLGVKCGKCAGLFADKESLEIKEIKKRVRLQFSSKLRRILKSDSTSASKSSKAEVLAIEIHKRIGSYPGNDYHLDHIVPVSWFDLRDDSQIEACWSAANFRYLTALENSMRGNKMTKAEFEALTEEQLAVFDAALRKPKYAQRWRG